MSKGCNVRLVAPSFAVPEQTLDLQVAQLQACGFTVSGGSVAVDGVGPKSADLTQALISPDCPNILCVRGGYGVADLLSRLPYEKFKISKRVIGYSDISALISALWTQRRFIGINGAMPASAGWGDITSAEMQALIGIMAGEVTTGELALVPSDRGAEGILFGGCLSVLTNLIATPYFPKSLAGYILFFEDINESVPRLLRYLNQWVFSGAMAGVQAVVLGRFDNLEGEIAQLEDGFRGRVGCPVYVTTGFGHSAPLYPIPVGGFGMIADGKLKWKIARPAPC